ncbi:Ribosomal large subunit pseudouridine synthase C [Pontiella desulfatans]|uniref:Ribosomal large subunit pseudouridine synthase C n=1 Tax=Pontiella desulfatans TaxID=2750659 RepID=A0A6C2TZP6_PONDE|nr:RNA pseudouridine synthase [Pontiella desulfatans]VGO12934.1 Ribosomal large subunit pseudouridine synthase C [Pontiella desulfatans]
MSDLTYDSKALDAFVLYADNHLLAVNKPAGLLSQDSGTGLRNLEDWAREWVRVDKGKPGAVFLNAVHRIDKAVSGIVLFARTSKALSRLNEDIRKRNCKKIYHVLVEGAPKKPSDQLVHWLSHENHRAEVCREGDQGAQRAVLSYLTLKRAGNQTLLQVDLETGRYHQIRAQLAAIGCPIAGDGKYGAKQTSKDGSIALHHRRLEVVHPTLKEPVIIEAPYPAESPWWQLLD